MDYLNRLDVGIDPGNSAGCITLRSDIKGLVTLEHYEIKKMTLQDLLHLQKQIIVMARLYDKVSVVMEKINSFGGPNANAMNKLARNCGELEFFMVGLRLPYSEVTPRTWQKFYNMKKDKKEGDTQWKRRLRGVAEKLYPKENFTNSKIDSTLLAHYNYKNQ